MRTISTLLLALNLAFIAAIAYLAFLLNFRPAPLRPAANERVVTNTVRQIAVRKINATNLLAALANRPVNWAALESSNYVTYINNLRNFGCPEETVRDIIVTDIAKSYGRRRAQIRAQSGAYQFWKTSDTGEIGDTSDPKVQAQLNELDREQTALIQELLGIDYRAELAKYSADQDYEERAYGFLSQEKREQVIDLQAKYDDLERQIYDRSKGFLLEADQEALRRLQGQRDAQLAQLMSPEEYQEYQLRNSPTAVNLRAQLHGFNPNELEFRRIFQLQKAYDDQISNLNLADPAQAEAHAAAQADAQQALDQELAKVLGPDRFKEYQRAQDADYKALLQFSQRFETSPALAARVYDMKVAAERQKLRLETDPALRPEQRAQALAAIAEETERSVAQLMGGQNSQLWVAYQSIGNQWIQNLGESDFEMEPEVPEEAQVAPAPRLFPFLPQPPPLPVPR
ncbi:MAG: hypothetical protein L0Y58_25320 [Verrucomicrobia subdivision 3 bacterium]|nr:hypothetical protein [Limisphaerales bacterium]